MRILYDLIATQAVGTSKFHGGGEYAKIVFKHLVKNRKDAEIICFFNKNNYLDKDLIKIIKENQLKLLNIKNKKSIQDIIITSKIDKVYSALPYQFYGLNFGEIEFVCTIHGLRAIEMQTDIYEIKYAKNMKNIAKFLYKNCFKKKYISIKRNQFNKLFTISKNITIITPSQHTKYSLLCYFPKLKKEQIYVQYSPRKKTVPIDGIKKIHNLGLKNKQYFLIISSDRWIKNPYRAIKALNQLFNDFPELQKIAVVLGIDKIDRFKRLINNKEKFMFYGYVEGNMLEILYKHAYCLIYPTLNEGFGYPPLETMKYGTPVLCSAITSITEICRDGVIYFNPFSIEEIKNRVLQLMFEPSLYERYSQRGKEVSKLVAVKQDQMLDKLVDIILK